MERPIASQMVRNALMAVGIEEDGNNAGDKVEYYQSLCIPPLNSGDPWCAAFVRSMMKLSAVQTSLKYEATFPRSGYTPDWANYAKKHKLWIPASDLKLGIALPRKGDIALFYFSQIGRIGHIGIVIEPFPTYMWTVEGNTSPERDNDQYVEREGDGVYKKNRSWSELGALGGIMRVNF